MAGNVDVIIPSCATHNGQLWMRVSLPWFCIHCGEPRGEPFLTTSWDGSRSLRVNGWTNPCGHIERYSEIRAWLDKNAGGNRSQQDG